MDIANCRKMLLLGKTIYDFPLRVVNYDRVSTDKEEQKNSLKNQENYFKDMIQNVKGWSHVHSYSDEGISGTRATNREEFMKMMDDAKAGCFDLIVTKEISRFARNTLDSIYYTQLLLQYGVVVFFVSDNINTIYPDSEFRLTLMASMAQDEVRKLSERVKFGIQRSIRDEKLGGSSLYGYHKEKGKMTLIEDEAEVVRRIFLWYSTGRYSFLEIRRLLMDEGIFTRNGNPFSDTTIRKMITNPRYKGWYTANMSEVVDYKSHFRRVRPRDEWVLHKCLNGDVPPIVREEVWDRANQVYLSRKKSRRKRLGSTFLYTSKILCQNDNHFFVRCESGKRKGRAVWQCVEYAKKGVKGCVSPLIPEDVLNTFFLSFFDEVFPSFEDEFSILTKEYENEANYEEISTFLRLLFDFHDNLSFYLSLISCIHVSFESRREVFLSFSFLEENFERKLSW